MTTGPRQLRIGLHRAGLAVSAIERAGRLRGGTAAALAGIGAWGWR